MKPKYVIHTAYPFIEDIDVPTPESENKIKKYILSSQLMARASYKAGVRKLVMTGAATSIVGK